MKKILLISLLLNITSLAQLGGSEGITDFLSSSMGNTYTTSSNGVYSIGKNPANLFNGLDDKHFEISTFLPFPNIGLFLGQEFMTFDQFNYYFGGIDVNGKKEPRYLNDDDKNNLQKLINEGGTATFNTYINYISLMYFYNKSIGAIAFSMDDIMGYSFRLPKDLVEFGLNGNPLNSVYNFDDTKVSVLYYRNYSISYARTLSDLLKIKVDDISFGLSLKFIKGYVYLKTESVNSEIKTLPNSNLVINGNFLAYSSFSPDFGLKYSFENQDDETELNISPFLTPAGSGVGIDFGFAINYDSTWRFGLSFTDLGNIKFDKKVAKFQSNTAFVLTDITDENQLDSLANSVKSDAFPLNEGITASLPSAMHLGASAKINNFFKSFPGELVAAIDLHKGFNDVLVNSKTFRLALGLQWKPFKAINFRTGFSVGGSYGSSFSMGLGFDLGALEFGFSSYKFNSILKPNSSNYFSINFGSRWKF
jgi:hypothetical protein